MLEYNFQAQRQATTSRVYTSLNVNLAFSLLSNQVPTAELWYFCDCTFCGVFVLEYNFQAQRQATTSQVYTSLNVNLACIKSNDGMVAYHRQSLCAMVRVDSG